LSALSAALTVTLAACGGQGTASPATGGGDLASAKAVLERQDLPDYVTVPDIASVRTKGNVGEDPAWYGDVTLSDDELQEVQGMGLTAAFLNWDDSSYNQAILAGAREALAAMNIELVATTNYSFDSTQLASSALNIAALQPDIVFYSGLDPVSDVEALRPLTDQGAAVVSYANAPGEWTTGDPENFVTLISYDTHAIGAVVADAVHDKFPDGARVGMIYFDAVYKLVNEREEGFMDQLETYDNLELVTREPMTDPFSTEDIANAMITRDPDLDVIFAPWDLPAEGVEAALQGAGREDIAIATIDLGFTGVQDLGCGGPIFVESSQLVYEWGRTGAIAAARHALGADVPPYVIVPVFAVTADNLEDGWDLAYQGKVPLPPEVQDCLAG
jgi:ribose transport system substrate-binding protein